MKQVHDRASLTVALEVTVMVPDHAGMSLLMIDSRRSARPGDAVRAICDQQLE